MDLATAKSKRAALIKRVNEQIVFALSAEVDALNFYQLKVRIDRHQDVLSQLEAANDIVAGAEADDTARQALWTEFHGYEDRFINAQAELTSVFVAKTPVVAPPPAANANEATAQIEAAAVAADDPDPNKRPSIVVQMPFQPQHVQQTWGTFNGNLLDWQDFRARFELAVHNRKEIPDEYKLSYLRNSLKGEAAQASRGWVLKAENYKEAWDELVEKNERRYPLACAYLSRFFSLKKMAPDAGGIYLQRLSNETNELVRQLGDLKYPIQHWNLVIVHALQERLNKTFEDKWDTERDGCDEPTIEQMTKFLDKHANKAANKNLAYSSVQVSVPNERAQRPQLQSVVQRPPPTRRDFEGKYHCSVCDRTDHLVFDCPEFKPLSLSDRKKVVLNNGMCMNCLKRGHYKDNCFDLSRCQLHECRGDSRHNSMLCPVKNQTSRAMVASYDDRQRSSGRDTPSSSSRFSGNNQGRGQSFKRSANNNQS